MGRLESESLENQICLGKSMSVAFCMTDGMDKYELEIWAVKET